MIVPTSSPASTSYSRASRIGVSGVVSDLSNQQRSFESNSSSEPSVDLSVHDRKNSSGGGGDVWKLTSSRSPRSAEVICPVDMKLFQEQLNLGEDMVSSPSISSVQSNAVQIYSLERCLAFLLVVHPC
jgi:hypothetical protein